MFRVSISCDTHCIKINAKQLICRSQWPLRLRHGSAAACLLGLCIRIPLEEWLFVSFEWCVLSGIGLNDGLILCPEEPLSVIMCKSNSSSHVQKQLFISCAKATLHLTCKSNSSSHVQKQLFISCAKATVHLTCKSNSSSRVQKQLFISRAKATLHLMCKSNSSSHVQKQLFISWAKATLHLMGKSNSSSTRVDTRGQTQKEIWQEIKKKQLNPLKC